MSMFDKYTTSEYMEAMRSFIGANKSTFKIDYGFIDPNESRVGRLSYNAEAIKRMEDDVNKKSLRAEEPDTSVGERIKIAQSYRGLTDVAIARELNVSRELVRRWTSDINPTPRERLEALATFLEVPLAWLAQGGLEHLPANSRIGLRVGEQALQWREYLYGLTQAALTELADLSDESLVQAHLEWVVFNNPEMAAAARRAGGRWQFLGNALLFSPWEPIEEHGLSRRYWTDEVEEIIQQELSSQPTVFAAWKEIKQRCTELGYGPNEYPKRISLHKRIEKERERAEKFGVDLNPIIAYAVQKHSA